MKTLRMVMLKILAFAVASNRVGYVYLDRGKLKDWRISKKAWQSPGDAAYIAQTWINDLCPHIVVTEDMRRSGRKGERSREVKAAISRVAEQNYLLDVLVTRSSEYKNKYEEAAALAERYPDIQKWVPQKRLFYENEPRATVLFEALALADSVHRGGSLSVATAMG